MVSGLLITNCEAKSCEKFSKTFSCMSPTNQKTEKQIILEFFYTQLELLFIKGLNMTD